MMVSLGRRTVTDGHPTLSIPPMQYERAFDDMLIAYSTLPGIPHRFQMYETVLLYLKYFLLQDLSLIGNLKGPGS